MLRPYRWTLTPAWPLCVRRSDVGFCITLYDVSLVWPQLLVLHITYIGTYRRDIHTKLGKGAVNTTQYRHVSRQRHTDKNLFARTGRGQKKPTAHKMQCKSAHRLMCQKMPCRGLSETSAPQNNRFGDLLGIDYMKQSPASAVSLLVNRKSLYG